MKKLVLIESGDWFYNQLTDLNNHFELKHVEEGKFESSIKTDFHAVLVTGRTTLKTPFDYLKYFNFNHPLIPVFLMLEKNSNTEIIFGYEIGMNGVIVWPKPVDRVVAKINAELKKIETLTNYSELGSLCFCLDEELMELKINSQTHNLTPLEFLFLKILKDNKNQLVKKEELIHQIWPEKEHSDGALNTHVYNLKKKIPELHHFLKVKKNVGYTLKLTQNQTTTPKKGGD